MNCTETQDLLSDYIDDELAAGPRAHVDAHLAGCPACAAEHRALRRTVQFVRGNAATVPAGSAPGAAYEEFMRAVVDETYGKRPEQVIADALSAPDDRRRQ